MAEIPEAKGKYMYRKKGDVRVEYLYQTFGQDCSFTLLYYYEVDKHNMVQKMQVDHLLGDWRDEVDKLWKSRNKLLEFFRNAVVDFGIAATCDLSEKDFVTEAK